LTECYGVYINSYTGVNETLLLLILITVQRLAKVSNVAESSKRSDVALLHIFHSVKKFPTF